MTDDVRNAPGGYCIGCRAALPESGPDPCLGELPGVNFACCGHGVAGGYVSFVNGTVLYFAVVEEVFDATTRTMRMSLGTLSPPVFPGQSGS